MGAALRTWSRCGCEGFDLEFYHEHYNSVSVFNRVKAKVDEFH